MSERLFVDTNVLVCADDADAGRKRTAARAVLRQALEQGTGVISTQVVQEYFSVATRKLRIDAPSARRRVELLAALDVVRVEVPMILSTADLVQLHGLGFWDALIVVAARVAGCRRLLSEDLQHGQRFDGLTVENPFC